MAASEVPRGAVIPSTPLGAGGSVIRIGQRWSSVVPKRRPPKTLSDATAGRVPIRTTQPHSHHRPRAFSSLPGALSVSEGMSGCSESSCPTPRHPRE
jgi:hypothetical protein